MNKVIKRYKNGLAFELIAGYDLMEQWYSNSEIQTQDWCIDNFKPDWVSMDIGAHIGYYSMLFSCLSPSGSVWAFEPNEAARKMMSQNIAHNQGKSGCAFTNVRVMPFAVGNITGNEIKETLWLTDGTNEYGKTEGKFSMITLDDFCIKHNMLDRLDFIKIDVDGWDYEVLLGAKETLKKFRPHFVIEVNYALAWRNHTYQDILAILEETNYSYMAIDPCPGQWICWPKEKSLGVLV